MIPRLSGLGNSLDIQVSEKIAPKTLERMQNCHQKTIRQPSIYRRLHEDFLTGFQIQYFIVMLQIWKKKIDIELYLAVILSV